MLFKSISSLSSLCMCKTIVAFSHRRDILDRKYDLMRRIAEKDLAFVAGITTCSNKHVSFTTWVISALSPTDMPLTSDVISCMQVIAVEG